MDRQTSRLRTLIGNLHNRNRVLERQEDLSPAALRWLAAPLEAAAARALEAAQAYAEQGQGGEEPPMGTDGMPLHKHELIAPPSTDAAAPDSSGGDEERGSLIKNPLMLRAIAEYRAALQAAKESSFSSTAENGTTTTAAVAKESAVFSPRLPDCTEEYLEQHRRAGTLDKKQHLCSTPAGKKKQLDLHGPKHNDKFPDYIHFVHIPKVGERST